jgi:hypothetical protein
VHDRRLIDLNLISLPAYGFALPKYSARYNDLLRVIPQPSYNDLLRVGINRYSNVLSVAIELYRLTLSDAVSGVGINL